SGLQPLCRGTVRILTPATSAKCRKNLLREQASAAEVVHAAEHPDEVRHSDADVLSDPRHYLRGGPGQGTPPHVLGRGAPGAGQPRETRLGPRRVGVDDDAPEPGFLDG